MRFFGVLRIDWVMVVVVAVVVSLSSGPGDFFRRLPVVLLTVAVTCIVLTALGRLLLRLIPEGRFKRLMKGWL